MKGTALHSNKNILKLSYKNILAQKDKDWFYTLKCIYSAYIDTSTCVKLLAKENHGF